MAEELWLFFLFLESNDNGLFLIMFLYIMFQVGSMISFDDIFGICPDSPLLRCFGLP